MAWEVAQRLNKANVPCNLITGQEREDVDGARHSSVTVEMADVTSEYQCAVVDEIQVCVAISSYFELKSMRTLFCIKFLDLYTIFTITIILGKVHHIMAYCSV